MRFRGGFLLSLLLWFAGCGGGDAQTPSLPPDLPGGFTLGDVRQALEVPAAIAQLGVESSHEARYAGPSPLTVMIYRMKTQASAFELVQKWQPEPDALHFHAGPYFVILRGSGLDQAQRNSIAAVIEKHLQQ